jgi:two-component system response regulator NreC
MLNIIIADDHALVRRGIKLILETDPNISITGEAVSATEVLDQLKMKNQADIILADLNMPEMSGIELLQEVRAQDHAVKVVFLTMVEDRGMVSAAFENGAEGYLLKNIGANELLYAVNHIYNGGKYISTDLFQHFFTKSLELNNSQVSDMQPEEFSSREMEVLGLISEGFTNSEIGDKLFLSKRTVEGHRLSLIAKTGCRNSAALIKYAVMHGLVK